MTSPTIADLALRGQAIYDQQLRALLEPGHLHEFVAIEPDSGDYFLGRTLSQAMASAHQAHPDRLAFAVRIGHECGVQIGVLGP